MKRKLIFIAGVLLVAACSGTDTVGPRAQKVTSNIASDEDGAAGPVKKDNTPAVCEEGSPGNIEFVAHAPIEVVARLCFEKKAEEKP